MSEEHQARSPMYELRNALIDAQVGMPPSFTNESLVKSLGLESEDPDGRALMDRFTGDGSSGNRIGALRAFTFVKGMLLDLITATNERTANSAQEVVAQALGAVVTRQMVREGQSCEFVQLIAVTSTREDIIAPEIRTRLSKLGDE